MPQSPAPPPAAAPVLLAAAEESEDEYELEFDPLLFIKRLPPLEQCFPARRTSFLLPRWVDWAGTLVAHKVVDGSQEALMCVCLVGAWLGPAFQGVIRGATRLLLHASPV